MFVLIWMHFSWWFQIWSWNSRILTYFTNVVTFLTCRLHSPAAWKALRYYYNKAYSDIKQQGEEFVVCWSVAGVYLSALTIKLLIGSHPKKYGSHPEKLKGLIPKLMKWSSRSSFWRGTQHRNFSTWLTRNQSPGNKEMLHKLNGRGSISQWILMVHFFRIYLLGELWMRQTLIICTQCFNTVFFWENNRWFQLFCCVCTGE